MMDITPAVPEGRQVVHAYGEKRFRISGSTWEQPVLIMPQQTVPWAVAGFDDISFESLQPLLDATPAVEILLFGCGPRMALINPSLRAALRERGIMSDLMDTGAACRTYNVLMAEDRRVAAAVLPVE
jgi:uncharacterized protein